MKNHVIETVVFKLLPNKSNDDFLATVPASTSFIENSAGFVSRRLSCGEDGTWIEHVEWETMEDAQKAGALFMSDPSLASMRDCIDGKNAQVFHTELKVSLS